MQNAVTENIQTKQRQRNMQQEMAITHNLGNIFKKTKLTKIRLTLVDKDNFIQSFLVTNYCY